VQLNKKFIEELHQKLTFGNTRSILINALPGRQATRLAVSDLNIIEIELAKSFLETLTTNKKAALNISIDFETDDDAKKQKLAKVAKRLDSINYENDDIYKETGVETFGFGFPLLFAKHPKDQTKFILAPIFVFRLAIKQSTKRNNEWNILKNEDSEIKLNESLVSFFESEGKIKIPGIHESTLDDGILSQDEISDYCNSLLTQLGSNHSKIDFSLIDTLPEKIDLKQPEFQRTRILNTGVFGIYKNHKQNIIKDLESLLDNIDLLDEKNDGLEPKWGALHSPMPTDPSQNGVLRSLSQNRKLIIQGPPGTGKSQTLTAIIASALANNKKVLVVCEKRTALDVLHEKLTELIPETKSAIALIEDVVADRANIVQKVRNRTAAYLSSVHSNSVSSISEIRRFEDQASKIESQYLELRKELWQSNRWKDIVGMNHKIRRNITIDETSIHLLNRILKEAVLTEEQYDKYSDLVGSAELFHASIAEHKEELGYALKETEFGKHANSVQYFSKLNVLLADTDLLIREMMGQLIIIETEFKSKHTIEFEKLIEKIELIRNIIEEHTLSEIIKPSLKTKLLSIFSKKHKAKLNYATIAKNELSFIKKYGKFSKSIDCTLVNIDQIYNDLQKNQSAIVSSSIEISMSELDFGNQVESDLSEIKSQINSIYSDANDLFNQQKIKLNINNYQKTLIELQQLRDTVKQYVSKRSLVEAYFDWRRLYNTQDHTIQSLIDNLIRFNSKNWKHILHSAWLEYLLHQNYENEKYPTHDRPLNLLRELQVPIHKNLLRTVSTNISNWHLEGIAALKKKNIEINQLYNLRGSKGNTRNSLRRIVQSDLDSFTSIFPLIMLNPEACSTLLPLKRNLFDLVIFDEASQLRLEDTFTALLRGKQIVISGDSMQMPPSNYFSGERQPLDEDEIEDDSILDQVEMATKESLLEFGIDNGFVQTYLDMHYRSKHPDLISFSNACFYNSRLIPMPEKSSDIAIQYINVNGLYENNKNETEAKTIIDILKNSIDRKQSVGIATFNIQQRNLILTLIREERLKDSAFDNKISTWESMHDSLFVKNLENIQGDERDVILISTTFGTRRDGRFIMNFGPIGQKNGHRLLNVIVTRSKCKMYLVTSIPEQRQSEWVARLTNESKVNGTTGLLAFLTYCKSVSNGNNKSTNDILETIRRQLKSTPTSLTSKELELTESPFEEEVYSMLKETIGSDRIELQHKCGGFRIDIVILPANPQNRKKLAVECDGAAYHSSPIAWHNDIFRQQQLEQHDFVFHRIWSTNWWKNPTEEFELLVDSINKLDKSGAN
jgi:very-short-patch-repair endonuclease